jgi:NAD(P)-dependent dehydrogenase (short-subunit alcohol dehydrogenase family)
MDDLAGRVALVTGGSRGIGRATALALAEAGADVAVNYRSSAAEAQQVCDLVAKLGRRTVKVGADVSVAAEAARLARAVEAALGPIGVLVNNASIFESDTVATATRDSWERHIAINLRAPFVLMQSFARHLPEDAGGVIVNLLDERVWNLTPYFASYTVSKAGLWTLTQTMALALAPRIRVNGIGPGPTLPSPRQLPQQFLDRCRKMPLQRGTSPDEIAAALRFILAAPAMTGQMIALDGGEHLGWAQPDQGEVIE